MSTRYVWDKYSLALPDLSFSTAYSIDASSVSPTDYSVIACTSYTRKIESGRVMYSAAGSTRTISDNSTISSDTYRYVVVNGYYTNLRKYFSVLGERTASGADWYLMVDTSHSGSATTKALTVYTVTGTVNPGAIPPSDVRVNFRKSESAAPIKGDKIGSVSYKSNNAYPTDGISEDYYFVYKGSDTIDPTAVTYSKNELQAGESITISVNAQTPTYGGTVYYQYQYSINGGSSWTNIGSKTTSTSASVTVPSGATKFQARVLASDDMGFTSNTYVTGSLLQESPNTAPSTPSSISIPSSIKGGTTITITWGASTDAENNLEGYIVERSTDGGSNWVQVYSGSSTSTTNTVPAGSHTVMYRVRAYDSEGLYSDYKTSSQVTVSNNSSPTTPARITVPSEVYPGDSFTISWGASTDPDGNLSGYEVQRAYDGSSSWSIVTSKTTATSLSTTVTEGHTSVQYRVRAKDSEGATSSWRTSSSIKIVNLKAYIGINGKAQAVKKIYVGVNGKAREVVKGYVGVGGKARRFL